MTIRCKCQPLAFQSTHPCGVRRMLVAMLLCQSCFNPRTRVGCDAAKTVSLLICIEFQSTHPCGVRQASKTKQGFVLMFQSTHPCGVRLVGMGIVFQSLGFNPRTRVGCDPMPLLLFRLMLFQSTHPCGVRRKFHHCTLPLGSFNPRTRVGCDNARSI